jgi:phage head maturation protease
MPVENLSQYFKGLSDEERDLILERKGYDSTVDVEEPTKEFIAKISVGSIDADGDYIVPDGIDTSRYMLNPVLLWGHKHTEFPIGKCLDIKKENNSIIAKYKVADTTLANELWSLIKGGFLRANSVGFLPKEMYIKGQSEFNTICKNLGIDIKACKRIITKWVLLENSLVSIPSNKDALIMAYTTKSLELSDKLVKELDITCKDAEVATAEAVTTEEVTTEEAPAEAAVTEVKPEYIRYSDITLGNGSKIKLGHKEDGSTILLEEIAKVQEEPKVEQPPKEEPPKVWNVIRHGSKEDKALRDKQLQKNGFIIK